MTQSSGIVATSVTICAQVENIALGAGWVSEVDLSWNSIQHNEVTAADKRTEQQQGLRSWGAIIHLLEQKDACVRVCICVCVRVCVHV